MIGSSTVVAGEASASPHKERSDMSTFKPGDPRTISCGRKGAAVTKPVVKRDPDGKFTTRAPKKEPA